MEGSLRRRQPRGKLADAAIVLVVTAIVVIMTLTSSDISDSLLPLWISWPVQLAACVALYWRRVRPQTVMAVTLVLIAIYYPLTGEGSPVFVTIMIALYSVAASGQLRASMIWAGVVMAITIGGELASPVRHLDNIALAMFTGWCVATVAVGVTVHDRMALLAETKRRAAETALREAAQERLRIARDVHDVVGHHLSLINVQASAALHRIDKDPGQAETALATIKTTSSQTLGELRKTLDVLRQSDEEPPTTPTPGLADIEALFDGVRSAGMTVDHHVDGEPRELPVEVDLACYRIVQEALTNVVKHANATRVTIRLAYRDDTIDLAITDDGVAEPPTTTSGHGIRGMTERAQALGGELSAEPTRTGFTVHATLPAPTREST
ncbi:sensor histidine kinase [Stackebrandtia nassauensis]|uniref:histidine kinase n=1 Tax=Stackebrandtia nassauensis (strain DSM 44728 / CIP 108903 / NRRL B-16338 / NBRC 102104 / LLR-40K-21) TaxID=446470 RepID=D3Q0J5_STANL|nr:sensor histidine kinase [Stackebrandtia nassauensis]ADD41731.1 histidine kinase [Stackebrandtia nassauensis DSM 44728]